MQNGELSQNDRTALPNHIFSPNPPSFCSYSILILVNSYKLYFSFSHFFLFKAKKIYIFFSSSQLNIRGENFFFYSSNVFYSPTFLSSQPNKAYVLGDGCFLWFHLPKRPHLSCVFNRFMLISDNWFWLIYLN